MLKSLVHILSFFCWRAILARSKILQAFKPLGLTQLSPLMDLHNEKKKKNKLKTDKEERGR